jgi:tetratricopeptide (TPR) repeat protein
MAKHASGRLLRWQATAILTLFFFAVAGAAALGWWYARESPAHQGPIVLISVDGLPASTADAPPSEPVDAEADRTPAEPRATPGIDALAADGVVFERAYSHSPLTLPAHASLFSGRLPFEHGARDEAGFTLEPGVRTLAELLRNRGFKTGGAVSSVLLRRSTGIAQGFGSYSENPGADVADELYLTAAPARVSDTLAETPGDPLDSGIRLANRQAEAAAIDEAERWALEQDDQRYFLFLAVGAEQADDAVSRLTHFLRERQLYDRAMIVLVGARGYAGADAGLDERVLRVPLVIKQPHQERAGHRVAVPVQHIDLLPTILDLVRAPIPDDLKGRSLKGLLTDEQGRIDPRPIYSESLAAYLRFGGPPLFGLTLNGFRYVRGMGERIEPLETADGVPTGTSEAGNLATADGADPDTPPDAITPLRNTLDRFLAGHAIVPPGPVPEADRERLALNGYLAGLSPMPGAADVILDDESAQRQLNRAHDRAARLAGQRRWPAAVQALQRIVRDQPAAASIHYQIGMLSAAMGRTEDAIDAFEAAASLRPDVAEVPRALALALAAAGRRDDAQVKAALAVQLAERLGGRTLSAAHQAAARVALARHDRELALKHADAAQAANPAVPMRPFIEGRLLVEAGRHEEAVPLLREAAAMLRQHETALEGLQTTLAAALVALDRPEEAEAACLEELRAFPRSLAAHSMIARIAGATQDMARLDAAVQQLLASAPTPEGYATAVQLLKSLGHHARADALRSDARPRVRGDPARAQMSAPDARR